jgi:hypothetical protein
MPRDGKRDSGGRNSAAIAARRAGGAGWAGGSGQADTRCARRTRRARRPDRMAASGYESTTTGEVAPRWMANAPPAGMAASVATGEGWVKDELRAPFAYRARVAASGPVRVRLPYAWFPGWEVLVDGRTAQAGPAAGSGLVEFPAPPGSHNIDLRFGRTWDRALGEAISILAAIALAGSGRWLRKAANRPAPTAASAG